ncbi:MAG: hypothetical protein P4L46_19685 [Fimbriimonas sp.]|nr:hypothetical protein [Fimbriimonas sp.]
MKHSQRNEHLADQGRNKEAEGPCQTKLQCAAEAAAIVEIALERAQDDGWKMDSVQIASDPLVVHSPNSKDPVASTWRVLPDAYAFPREDEYRAEAARNGWELRKMVRPEDGGYRHRLVVQPGTDGRTRP